MKFILDNWMLISLALTSGGMLLWPTFKGASATGVSPAAAVQLINREKAVVVDVRNISEYAAAHLGAAKNIPLPFLETKLNAVVKNKTVPLILVCQTGKRSARAVAIAKKLGYAKARSLGGGLAAWRAANLPVEKT